MEAVIFESAGVLETGSFEVAFGAVERAFDCLPPAVERFWSDIDCLTVENSLSEITDDETAIWAVQLSQSFRFFLREAVTTS
jgi:hypothetical protein